MYDRRNVGLSETVDAPQSPEDMIADLHGLVGAAGVEPPYVLLGASFGLERISHFKVIQAAQAYIGREPAIPVTYLSSIPEGFDVNEFGIPEYDEQILGLQEAYVERFALGGTSASTRLTSWRPRSPS